MALLTIATKPDRMIKSHTHIIINHCLFFGGGGGGGGGGGAEPLPTLGNVYQIAMPRRIVRGCMISNINFLVYKCARSHKD